MDKQDLDIDKVNKNIGGISFFSIRSLTNYLMEKLEE